jgi:competence protein ComFC
LFNKLKAKNDISYSGKTREFRMLNPRDFEVKSFKQKDVIIVDDIITTGATLTQAIQTLTQENKNVPFCLTLTDVSNKTN